MAMGPRGGPPARPRHAPRDGRVALAVADGRAPAADRRRSRRYRQRRERGRPPSLGAVAGAAGGRSAGHLLGLYPDIELTETTVRLDDGDIMIFHTHGVTQALAWTGSRHVRQRTSWRRRPLRLPDAADALIADVVDFEQGRLHDDVAPLGA